jgi:hypothetical protein
MESDCNYWVDPNWPNCATFRFTSALLKMLSPTSHRGWTHEKNAMYCRWREKAVPLHSQLEEKQLIALPWSVLQRSWWNLDDSSTFSGITLPFSFTNCHSKALGKAICLSAASHIYFCISSPYSWSGKLSSRGIGRAKRHRVGGEMSKLSWNVEAEGSLHGDIEKNVVFEVTCMCSLSNLSSHSLCNLCYGLNCAGTCSPPKKNCWNPNPQFLWVWP